MGIFNRNRKQDEWLVQKIRQKSAKETYRKSILSISRTLVLPKESQMRSNAPSVPENIEAIIFTSAAILRLLDESFSSQLDELVPRRRAFRKEILGTGRLSDLWLTEESSTLALKVGFGEIQEKGIASLRFDSLMSFTTILLPMIWDLPKEQQAVIAARKRQIRYLSEIAKLESNPDYLAPLALHYLYVDPLGPDDITVDDALRGDTDIIRLRPGFMFLYRKHLDLLRASIPALVRLKEIAPWLT